MHMGDMSVHIQTDWFWRWIRRGYVPPWLPESHDQNVTLIRIAATTAASVGHHRENGRFQFAYSDLFTFREGLIEQVDSYVVPLA